MPPRQYTPSNHESRCKCSVSDGSLNYLPDQSEPQRYRHQPIHEHCHCRSIDRIKCNNIKIIHDEMLIKSHGSNTFIITKKSNAVYYIISCGDGLDTKGLISRGFGLSRQGTEIILIEIRPLLLSNPIYCS